VQNVHGLAPRNNFEKPQPTGSSGLPAKTDCSAPPGTRRDTATAVTGIRALSGALTGALPGDSKSDQQPEPYSNAGKKTSMNSRRNAKNTSRRKLNRPAKQTSRTLKTQSAQYSLPRLHSINGSFGRVNSTLPQRPKHFQELPWSMSATKNASRNGQANCNSSKEPH